MRLGDSGSVAYAETGKGEAVVLIHGTLMALEDLWLPLGERLAAGTGSSRSTGPATASAPGVASSMPRPGGRRRRSARPWTGSVSSGHSGRPFLRGDGGALPRPVGSDAVAGVVATAPLCFPSRVWSRSYSASCPAGLGDGLAQVLATSLDRAMLPLLWRAIFLPQTVPPDFAARFPWPRACGPARMIAEGEDAMTTWTALSRAALAYPTCHVPVRFLGGTADLVVNNAMHGALAASLMRSARFTWLPGTGHMLHHFHQDRVVAEVEALRTAPG